MLKIKHGVFATTIALVLSMSAAKASTIVWNFEDAAMSGGTSLVGTFSTNADTGQLTAWDITIQGGSVPGYLFSSSIANYTTADGPSDYSITNNGTNGIDFDFIDPLNSGARQVNLVLDDFYCGACGGYYVSGDSGSAAAIPEPAFWELLIAGSGLAGWSLRRRFRLEPIVTT